jgi:hypothetical protein
MDETKLVGNWRLDWPYVRLGNYAVIQNRQLMNIGGQPITLEDLSDVRHKWQTKTGEVKDAPSDRETATAAWKKHMSDAIATDPMVCELCGTYRAKGGDDRMRHLYNAHPVEFAQRVGLEEQETSGEVMVSAIPDDEVSPANEDGTFSCCGRTYSSLGRLNQHRTVSKAHRTE